MKKRGGVKKENRLENTDNLALVTREKHSKKNGGRSSNDLVWLQEIWDTQGERVGRLGIKEEKNSNQSRGFRSEGEGG